MRGSKLQLWGAALIILAACNKANYESANVENAAENMATETNAADGEPAENLVFCGVVDARISQSDCDDLTKVDSQVQNGVGAFNVPNPMTRDETKAITLVVDRRTPAQIAAIEAAKTSNAAEETANDNVAMEANVSGNETSATDGNETSAETNEAEAPPPPPPPPPPEADGQGAPTPNQIVEPLEGETEKLTPKVGRFMSADLSGDGFTIQPLSPPSQEIPPGEQATWQWNVTPIQGGTHTLTLKTVVEGVVGGRHYPLSRTQTIRSVKVDVSWGGWLADKIAAATRGLNLLYSLLVALGLVVAGIIGVWKPWKNRNKD